MHRFPEIGDVVAGAALDVDQTGVTFGAVADHAIGTEPGKADADRDALTSASSSSTKRSRACSARFAVEQRLAAAEADLRQTRPLAHQNWKRARADLGVGDHAGENIEPAGRAFGIGSGDRSTRCRAA